MVSRRNFQLALAECGRDQAGPSDPSRHLCLVFFDILHLDGKSLLREPYANRRSLLESVLHTIQGFVSVAI